MARVIVMSPFDREFFGGETRLEIEAGTVFEVVAKLDAIGAGFADVAQVRATFAVDGVVTPDWSTGIGPGSEVILLPRVGGG